MKIDLKKIKNPVTPVLVILLVVASFYIGSLTSEVKYLKGNYVPTAGNPALAPDNTSELAKGVDRPNSEDHIRGNRNANIAIIEYSDYECPFCGQFHPSMKSAMETLGDSVMWVYRHFPLESIHPLARPAAIAAECVSELAGENAFWSFTDTSFDNQQLMSLDTIDQWAIGTGVNSADYAGCKTRADIAGRVDADIMSGSSAGIQGTPGTIVLNLDNGEAVVLPGAVSASQVVAAVDGLR